MTGTRTRAAGTRSRPGRPSNAVAADTRGRILDAAEALFATGGYDATSIRSVAAGANVAIAVVTYHVGSKEDLFDAVIQRRATVMERMREVALADALVASGGAPVSVAVLARAYVTPFLQFARTHDAGWQNFAILMGRLSNSPQGTGVIERYYDRTAKVYLAEMCRTLPCVPPEAVVISFMGMVSLMLFVCAGTGRIEALLAGSGRAMSDDAVMGHILDFCVSGLEGLMHRS